MKKVIITASMLIVLTSFLAGKSITIHSQVEGVKVYLNNEFIGITHSIPRQKYYEPDKVGLTLYNFNVGIHKFRFEYKNVKPKSCEIVTTDLCKDITYYLVFDEHRIKSVDHVIKGLPSRNNAPPVIKLVSGLEGATAKINGKHVSLNTPINDLKPGVYQVEFNLPDHCPLESRIEINLGAYAEIEGFWSWTPGLIQVRTECIDGIPLRISGASREVIKDYYNRKIRVVKNSDHSDSSRRIIAQCNSRKDELVRVFDEYEIMGNSTFRAVLCLGNDGKVKASEVTFFERQPLAYTTEIQQIVDSWVFDVDSELIINWLCRLPR